MRGVGLRGGVDGVMICWGRGVILMVCLNARVWVLVWDGLYRWTLLVLLDSSVQIEYAEVMLTINAVSNMLTSSSYDYHCHSNLVRSILPYGLTEFDVHDVLNVFQVTGLDSQGRYFMEASPATKDSFLTFFAELDLLCALSTCPGGDLSRWGWTQAEEGKEKKEGDDDEGMKSTCRPIRVEVYEIKEEVKGEVLKGWKKPEKSGYRGMHGMRIPEGEA